MKELQQRDEIIIINADKGGTMTIFDTDGYIQEANRQLNNEQCYQKLSSNHTPTPLTTQLTYSKHKIKIPEKVAEGLKVRKPKTPTLKLPPKVHKDGHPGRPLASSIDSPTSKISEYVDFHLQPYTCTVKSHIKDTKNLLNELDQVLASESNDSYLVTLDVRSLYTNIPNEQGVNVIKNLLQRNQRKLTTDSNHSFLMVNPHTQLHL